MGHLDGFGLLRFRIGDIQILSSQLRCHFRHSGCFVPGFLRNLNPFFRSALRLTWPFDGSVNAHVLALRNSPYLPDLRGPLLIPIPFSPFRPKLLFPPCGTKVRASLYNTTVRDKLRSAFCEWRRESLPRAAPLGRRCYGSLFGRTVKSAARPPGTSCHCGFNSSVQPFPVNGVLLRSAGAGT